MRKYDLSVVIAPLLSSSIAISYGGFAVAFSLIASWQMLEGFQVSSALIAWAVEAVLGAVLMWAGFATLMTSKRGRVVMVCGLVANALFKLVRTSAFFPLIASRTYDQSRGYLVLAILVAAVLLALSPSSVRYTSATSRRR